MIYALLYGLLTGIILSSMLGTVFFYLIQNSIERGFKSGAFIAAGVILSDAILIIVTYFSSNLFPSGGKTEMIVRICGGILLIAMGISNIYSNKKIFFPAAQRGRGFLLASRGFMLNILNPANYISWLSVSAVLINVIHFTIGQRYWFYGGALFSIFTMEMLISYGAAFLKRFISQKSLHLLNAVLGIVFIIFAILLIKPLIFK